MSDKEDGPAARECSSRIRVTTWMSKVRLLLRRTRSHIGHQQFSKHDTWHNDKDCGCRDELHSASEPHPRVRKILYDVREYRNVTIDRSHDRSYSERPRKEDNHHEPEQSCSTRSPRFIGSQPVPYRTHASECRQEKKWESKCQHRRHSQKFSKDAPTVVVRHSRQMQSKERDCTGGESNPDPQHR